MLLAVTIFVVALVLANFYATWLVISEDTLESVQKFWQVVIIWFIPLIGICFISCLNSNDKTKTKTLSKFQSTNDTVPTEFDVIDDFASSSTHDSFDGE